MQQNILQDSSVTKIFLIYTYGCFKKKEIVNFRFMDHKECYFAAGTPVRFEKPRKKLPAELRVYTSDGVYRAKVTLLDASVSLREVMYEVTVPKNWDFIQLRASSRKLVELPISIKFNDGFAINTTTYDLALGGCSFYSREKLSSIYTRIPGILNLELPKETLFNFPDGHLTVETKFVREKSDNDYHFGEFLYIFKFINLPKDDQEILKKFLINLN